VQETLAEAFYNIASLKDPSRFEPWLFRIAYHRCIDFIRRERRRSADVAFEKEHDVAADAAGYADAFNDTPIDDALAALVIELPPKERASVLLKDVLGYPLEEVAGIADSTLGGVKAALHRARGKLRGMKQPPRLEILGANEGIMSGLGATYSTNYTALPWEWRLEAAVVDGLPVIVHWRRDGDAWRPHAAIRLWWDGDRVARIRDYIHVEYLLEGRRIG